MMPRRIQGLCHIHFMIQAIIVIMTFWLYAILFSGFDNFAWFHRYFDKESFQSIWFEHYLLYCALIVAGLTVHELRSDHEYQLGVLHGNLRTCHRLARSKVIYSVTFLIIYLLATRDTTISRLFMFSFFPLMYLVLFISDWRLPKTLAKRIFHGLHEQRALLIGSRIRAASLSGWLNRKALLGIRAVGLINDEQISGEDQHIPTLGGIDELEKVIREQDVTHVILLEFPFLPSLITHLVHICDKLGIRLLIVDNLEERVLHPITHFEDDGIQFFCVRDEPLQNPVNRLLKRTVDICISLPVVVFILPTMTIIVWIFQKLQSPGPIFYWQSRAGLQNREFEILKFRTMQVDNPDVTRQASFIDDRIYPAGRILRKFSIDEFPQFWNVLKGDMSVVGPRPHLTQHNERFARIMDSYYIRAYVKPGITGLAQIKGFRGETKLNDDLIRRIEWDLYYVENWSLELEMMVIFKTFGKVLFPPDNAY